MRLKNCLFIVFAVFVLSTCHRHPVHRYQGYVDGENLYLGSQFSGKLIYSWVKRGDHVVAGQKLFKLDDNPQILAIKEAMANLAQAKNVLADLKRPKRKPEIQSIMAQIGQADAQIKLAELRYKRNQELFKKNAVDLDTVDAARERWQEVVQLKAHYMANLSVAQLGSRKHQILAQKFALGGLVFKLKQIQWQLQQKTITAPSDGIIFDTLYYPGEYVSEGKPVVVFLPPEHMRIEFFVSAADLPFIKLNDNIKFNCVGCKGPNEARIDYVSPSAEYAPPLIYSRENNEKLVFRVTAEIKDPWNYHPGMPIEVMVTEHG